MIRSTLFRYLWAPVLSVAVAGAPAHSTEDPERVDELLQRLGSAVSSLDYEGLVTFEHAGMLDTLRVVRAVKGGALHERIHYLSGSPREVVSTLSLANHCLAPGSGPVMMWSGVSDPRIHALYDFYLRGQARIANRDTVVLEVRPKDNDRFGVILNLDTETGLPLKSVLVGADGGMLERYQFVDLKLGAVGSEALSPETAAARHVDNSSECTLETGRWALKWTPAGYRKISRKQLPDGEMMVFTDGLAVFSVFVQSYRPELAFRGRAFRGATVAYMGLLQAGAKRYNVTVVGEIPDNTAKKLADSVVPSRPE